MDWAPDQKSNDCSPEASQGLYEVDFVSSESYAFTKPISFSYFSQEVYVSNWRMVYSELC